MYNITPRINFRENTLTNTATIELTESNDNYCFLEFIFSSLEFQRTRTLLSKYKIFPSILNL